MARPRRRLWMRAESQHGELRIYVVPNLVVDGDECDAVFRPDKNEIEVESSPNETKMKAKLLHELLHVCFEGSSGDAAEKVLGSKTREGRSAREESIVSFLDPVLFDVLARNGWLKFPKPPRF